jgi:hypothetical protein
MTAKERISQFEIRPGIGIDGIIFGDTIEDAERSLGEGQSMFERDDGYSSHMLMYPEYGLSLSFNQIHGYRLSSIEVDSTAECSYLLFGEVLFPRNKEQVLEILRRNLSPAELEAIKGEGIGSLEEPLFQVSSLRINFYFDQQGHLQEFQWGPLWGSDDEVVWPNPSEPFNE